MRHNASSPPEIHGGFREETIAIAKAALDQIASLESELLILREAKSSWPTMSERDAVLRQLREMTTKAEGSAALASQWIKERDEWRQCSERLHEEARSWIVQHGCDCNHPGCKVCRDVRISREAFAEFDRLQAKSL